MGLDAVELVMAVEEKFGIEISDPEAEKAITVGDLQRLVLSKLNVSDEDRCFTQQAFHLIRRTATSTFTVSRKTFEPDTTLESFMPRETRREDWRRFQSSLGVIQMPDLERPNSVSVLIVSLAVITLLSFIWYGALIDSGAVFVAGLVLAVLVSWGGAKLTVKTKVEFPNGYSKVRDLARFIVAKHPELLHRARSKTWTEEEVRCLLREVIIEQLAVTEFDDNSRFVADLHID